MSNMIDFLNSINQTKVNLIRTAADPSVEERSFPVFPVLRSLSYHQDILFLVNELNRCAFPTNNLTPQMQYEFLLNVIPKGRRFAKWAKTEKDEAIELLQLHFKYSYDKAKDACLLLTNEDLQELKQLTGGQT